MTQETINSIAALSGYVLGTVIVIAVIEIRMWWKKKNGTYWS